MLAASTVPAMAAGSAQSGPTVGDCISDGLYGNEPNIEGPFAPGGSAEQEPGTKGGRVVSSNSPGPQVTNPDGTTRPGSSVGDIQQLAGGGAVLADCRAVTQ